MAQDITHISGTITARLDNYGLQAVCDYVDNWAAGDTDADRTTLLAALAETITATVGETQWGGCSATVADEAGVVTVTFSDDQPAGVVELCEMLAPWFVGKVTFAGDDGPARLDVGYGYARWASEVALISKQDRLWMGQLVFADGSTRVHVRSSEEATYQALVDDEEVDVSEGNTAEEALVEHFGDSDTVTYTVAPVDSLSL